MMKPFTSLSSLFIVPHRLAEPEPSTVSTSGERPKAPTVNDAERAVRLTAIEYRLLEALSLDAGGATTCESLRCRVWGERGASHPQAVRSAVRRLRRKLGDDEGKPRYILNERGLGYRMPAPEDPADRP